MDVSRHGCAMLALHWSERLKQRSTVPSNAAVDLSCTHPQTLLGGPTPALLNGTPVLLDSVHTHAALLVAMVECIAKKPEVH